MELKILFGFLTPISGFAIALFFKLDELAGKLDTLEEVNLWNSKKYPKSIADINKEQYWHKVVTGYYVQKTIVHKESWFIPSLILFIWGICILLVEFADTLMSCTITHDITYYTVCRGAVLVLATLWIAYAFSKWKFWNKEISKLKIKK